jgi:hypothetical protein
MGLCGVYVQGTRRGGVHMLEIVRGDAGWDGGAGVHECLRCVLRMCRLIGILRMEAELAEGTGENTLLKEEQTIENGQTSQAKGLGWSKWLRTELIDLPLMKPTM